MADTAKDKKIPDEVADIADGLRSIADQARELEARLRGVRGTRDLVPTATSRVARQPVDIDLYHRLRKMLETEPMRLAQIVEQTGLHENKVKVLLTKLQRDGVHIVNLGAANKALWFIPGPKALKRLEIMEGDDED